MLKFVRLITQQVPALLSGASVDMRGLRPQVTFFLKKKLFILPFVEFLKNNSRLLFLSLVDITAVDWLNFLSLKVNANLSDRFQLIYSFLSHYFNMRISFSFFVGAVSGVPSITTIFKASNWLERELWDMFGIFFSEHPDLRRILTDYGFNGFPLRKDFPLSGYEEVRYDESLKGIVYESLELVQEMRNFDSLTPWVGHVDFLKHSGFLLNKKPECLS